MSSYRSALAPQVSDGEYQPLSDPAQNHPLASSGLLDALHLAIDLTALELVNDRITDLHAAPADRQTLRLAINMGAPEETYLPSIFRNHETWTIACGYEQKTIFWRILNNTMNPEIEGTISALVEPGISRALDAGAEPMVLLAFVHLETISNHQRMMLLRALPCARAAIASPRRTTS